MLNGNDIGTEVLHKYGWSNVAGLISIPGAGMTQTMQDTDIVPRGCAIRVGVTP